MDKANMKHLAVVTTSFPDVAFAAGQEAAGSFVHDFVVELARHIRVTVVAPAGKSGTEQVGNLTIHRFAVPSLPLSLLKPANPLQWPAILQTMRAGQQAVTAVVQTGNIDHIFALWALPSGYWAKVAGGRAGVPYSIWALGSDIWSLGKVPLVRQALRDVLRRSRFCFADGYQLAADVTAISGRECTFLPSSRQLPILGTKPLATAPPYKLAFLGRWHPHKGTDLLLESLNLLTDEDWQRIAEVRIHGGGPLAELVQAEGKKLKEKGRPVIIGGYLNRDEATALYRWADYVLIPSRIESIPVVFSDAMQCRCPVVAMPVGDLPRLVAQYRVGVAASAVTARAFSSALRQALQQQPETFAAGLVAAQTDFNVAAAAKNFIAHVSDQSQITSRPRVGKY
jgi:glycosyltransferase involved in cell wall biosynthesis